MASRAPRGRWCGPWWVLRGRNVNGGAGAGGAACGTPRVSTGASQPRCRAAARLGRRSGEEDPPATLAVSGAAARGRCRLLLARQLHLPRFPSREGCSCAALGFAASAPRRERRGSGGGKGARSSAGSSAQAPSFRGPGRVACGSCSCAQQTVWWCLSLRMARRCWRRRGRGMFWRKLVSGPIPYSGVGGKLEYPRIQVQLFRGVCRSGWAVLKSG